MVFRVDITNTSSETGTIIVDIGLNYTDKLNGINESNIKISGSSETKRSLIEVGSTVKIYRNDSLEFHGIVDNIDFFEGGALAIRSSGYEKWLAFENGSYAGSPWSSTASATIFNAVIGESNYFTAGTINAGTSVDFRAESTDSLWNVLSNLIQATQQDIGVDYPNSEIDILDHKGSSSSVMTLNAGIQMGNVRVSQSYPLGNDIRVYGKSEGSTRIVSDAAQGQDATSKSTYGVLTKIIRDPKITTVSQANLVANAEVPKYKDPIKIYDFDVMNPNQSLVSGDIITLNSKSQELSAEEVRIVKTERGTRGGEEFLVLQVTNAAYSKLVKTTNELIAEAEKNARDQQTYDSYGSEYTSYTTEDTCIGGSITVSCSGWITCVSTIEMCDGKEGFILGGADQTLTINVNNAGSCPQIRLLGGNTTFGGCLLNMMHIIPAFDNSSCLGLTGCRFKLGYTNCHFSCRKMVIPVGTNCY